MRHFRLINSCKIISIMYLFKLLINQFVVIYWPISFYISIAHDSLGVREYIRWAEVQSPRTSYYGILAACKITSRSVTLYLWHYRSYGDNGPFITTFFIETGMNSCSTFTVISASPYCRQIFHRWIYYRATRGEAPGTLLVNYKLLTIYKLKS